MRVLIIGNGISGSSAYKFLKDKKYDVEFASDEDINIGDNLKNKLYVDRLFENLSFIVVSPGIPLDAKILILARARKIKIIGELELGSSYVLGDIIAVTGTNGKTTTVSLINHLLMNVKNTVFIGGNIGVAVTSFASKTHSDSITILECSSFQLESIEKFRPHISAILNISEDHLTRHKTLDNYIFAKQQIAKNQTEEDYLLINADCEKLMNNIPPTKAKIMFFSTKHKVFGCYIKNESIYFNDNEKETKLTSLKNIKLVGEHNLSNILCAVLAVYLQVKDKKILSKISTFQSIEHRIEYVCSYKQISFYNDSKATNIDSTLVATKSFENDINLILGGSEKGYSFDELFEKMPKNVKNIAIFGQTRAKIALSAKKYHYNNVYIFDDLRSCIKKCYELSKAKDIILLSPACASFDQFKNYEERGNVFKKIVWEIINDENIISKNENE